MPTAIADTRRGRFHGFPFNSSGRWAAIRGAPTPNCFAYSAFNRCHSNFVASAPTMSPIGVPLRKRSRTSKQMCQPAAPHAMKRRSMLCHSVRRVPPPKGSSSHRFSLPPQPYSSTFGSSASVTVVSDTCGSGRSHRGELHRSPSPTQVPIGLEGRPLAQMRRVGQSLPHHRRRMTELSDQDERPLLSVLLYLRPVGRTRCVLLAIGHLLLLVFLLVGIDFVGVDASMRSRWRSRAST